MAPISGLLFTFTFRYGPTSVEVFCWQLHVTLEKYT